MTDGRELEHRRGKRRAHLVLVKHEALPLACRAGVARKLAVGLEANLTSKRRLDLTLVATRAGEESATELRLDEELAVEYTRSGVEWRTRDGWVYVVGSGDRVRRKQRDDFV